MKVSEQLIIPIRVENVSISAAILLAYNQNSLKLSFKRN